MAAPRVLLRLLLLLPLAAALGGCAAGGDPPSDTFYRLDLADMAPAPQPVARPETVEVLRFDAQGVLADRPVAFSEVDGTLEQYSYHFWEDSPTVLLQRALVEYLRAANVFERVVSPELRVRPDLLVRGRILRFERLVRPGAGPSVAVGLELALIDPRTDDVKVLATYSETVAAQADTVLSATEALRAATARIFGRFVRDITNN